MLALIYDDELMKLLFFSLGLKWKLLWTEFHPIGCYGWLIYSRLNTREPLKALLDDGTKFSWCGRFFQVRFLVELTLSSYGPKIGFGLVFICRPTGPGQILHFPLIFSTGKPVSWSAQHFNSHLAASNALIDFGGKSWLSQFLFLFFEFRALVVNCLIIRGTFCRRLWVNLCHWNIWWMLINSP